MGEIVGTLVLRSAEMIMVRYFVLRIPAHFSHMKHTVMGLCLGDVTTRYVHTEGKITIYEARLDGDGELIVNYMTTVESANGITTYSP